MSQVLSDWGAVYRTVDLRLAFAPKAGDILAVVRFCREPINEIRARHDAIAERFGSVETEGLKILYRAIEWDREWIEIIRTLRDLGSGMSETDSLLSRGELSLTKSVGPRTTWPQGWPALYGHYATGLTIGQLLDEDVDAQLVRAGSQFTSEVGALGTMLEMDDLGQNTAGGMFAILPVYGRVDTLTLNTGTVAVQTTFDPSLRNLTLYLNRYTSRHLNVPLPLVGPEPTEPEPDNTVGGLAKWSKSMQVQGLAESDEIEAKLMGSRLGLDLDSRRDSFRYSHEREGRSQNPLLRLFPSFCDWETLTGLLLNPGRGATKANRRNGGDTASVFEGAVSRLLSLLGLVVVHLGRWGFERFDEDPQATADLLAWHPRSHTILLVGCTTADPSEKDLNTLRRLQARVSELFESYDPTPVLGLCWFCSVDAPANRGSHHGVRVLDANDLREMIAAAQSYDVSGLLVDKFGLPWDIDEHPTGL